MFQPGFRSTAGAASLYDVLASLGMTTNLECCIDVGDADSYPGTGTTLFDLSGNGANWSLSSASAFQGTADGHSTNEYLDLRIGTPSKSAPHYATEWARTGQAYTVFHIGLLNNLVGGGRTPIIELDVGAITDSSYVNWTTFSSSSVSGTGQLIFNGITDNGPSQRTYQQILNVSQQVSNKIHMATFAIDKNVNPNGASIRGQTTSALRSSQWTAGNPASMGDLRMIGDTTVGAINRLYCFAHANRRWSDTEISNLYTALQAGRFTDLP